MEGLPSFLFFFSAGAAAAAAVLLRAEGGLAPVPTRRRSGSYLRHCLCMCMMRGHGQSPESCVVGLARYRYFSFDDGYRDVLWRGSWGTFGIEWDWMD